MNEANWINRKSPYSSTNDRARAEATRAIEDNTDKLGRERQKLEDFEASLSQEETILEQIRDSLKGELPLPRRKNTLTPLSFDRQDPGLS